MEIDERLLLAAEISPERWTMIRFYRWSMPTVSLGKYQKSELCADQNFCSRQSIPVVRRPTGGRAVFHDDEITYAVVSNDPILFPGNIRETYSRIAAGLRLGLSRFGLTAVPATNRTESSLVRRNTLPCFSTAGRDEILWRNRKVVGSAQRRLKKAFLQHGSIPLRIDYDRMAGALGTTVAELKAVTIGIAEIPGVKGSPSSLVAALTKGFQEAWGVPVRPLHGAAPATSSALTGGPVEFRGGNVDRLRLSLQNCVK